MGNTANARRGTGLGVFRQGMPACNLPAVPSVPWEDTFSRIRLCKGVCVTQQLPSHPKSELCKGDLVSAVYMWWCSCLVSHNAFISINLLCMSNTRPPYVLHTAGMSAGIVKSSLHKVYGHPQLGHCLQHWPRLVRNHPPDLQLGNTAGVPSSHLFNRWKRSRVGHGPFREGECSSALLHHAPFLEPCSVLEGSVAQAGRRQRAQCAQKRAE